MFIDALLHPREFAVFFNDCKKADITLVTIDPVIAEFTSGAESKTRLKEKIDFVNGIITFQLPITPDVITKNIPLLIAKYGPKGKGVSHVDYLLAGMLVKHANDLLLLTKNAKDFPTSIFDLCSHFVISIDRSLQTYGVYQVHSEGKTEEQEKEIIKVPF